MAEELIYNTQSRVYHVGSRSDPRPKDGGYLDAYETRCGETCEVWRRHRRVRLGELNMRRARVWEENRYIPLLDRPSNNPYLCKSCTDA